MKIPGFAERTHLKMCVLAMRKRAILVCIQRGARCGFRPNATRRRAGGESAEFARSPRMLWRRKRQLSMQPSASAYFQLLVRGRRETDATGGTRLSPNEFFKRDWPWDETLMHLVTITKTEAVEPLIPPKKNTHEILDSRDPELELHNSIKMFWDAGWNAYRTL